MENFDVKLSSDFPGIILTRSLGTIEITDNDGGSCNSLSLSYYCCYKTYISHSIVILIVFSSFHLCSHSLSHTLSLPPFICTCTDIGEIYHFVYLHMHSTGVISLTTTLSIAIPVAVISLLALLILLIVIIVAVFSTRQKRTKKGIRDLM